MAAGTGFPYILFDLLKVSNVAFLSLLWSSLILRASVSHSLIVLGARHA